MRKEQLKPVEEASELMRIRMEMYSYHQDKVFPSFRHLKQRIARLERMVRND